METSPFELPPVPRSPPPRPKGTRRAWGKIPYELRYRQQHSDLLAAAMELGADHGIGATSVSDIVQRAGLAKRVFYEHFTDKEACFCELGRLISAESIAGATEAAAASVGLAPRQAILATLAAFRTDYPPALIEALWREAPAGSALAAAWADHLDAAAEVLFALGRALGSALADEQVHLASRLLAHGVNSVGHERRIPVEDLAEVCCYALGMQPRNGVDVPPDRERRSQ